MPHNDTDRTQNRRSRITFPPSTAMAVLVGGALALLLAMRAGVRPITVDIGG